MSIDVDGNLHALRQYERKIDKAEANQEAYEKRLREVIEPMIEDAESMFEDIQREFGISDGTFLDYLKEL